MGDMGDIFRAMKKHKKEKRASYQEDFMDKGFSRLTEILGQEPSRHTEYHFSFFLQGKRVDYWPSGSKWRWKNKTFYGSQDNFFNFVRKRKDK